MKNVVLERLDCLEQKFLKDEMTPAEFYELSILREVNNMWTDKTDLINLLVSLSEVQLLLIKQIENL